MKPFKILAALVALAVIGAVAQPAHAEKSLRERNAHMQKKLERYREKYYKKQRQFSRNHPNPTRKELNNLEKWDRKYARKGERMTNKANAVSARLARKRAHHRH